MIFFVNSQYCLWKVFTASDEELQLASTENLINQRTLYLSVTQILWIFSEIQSTRHNTILRCWYSKTQISIALELIMWASIYMIERQWQQFHYHKRMQSKIHSFVNRCYYNASFVPICILNRLNIRPHGSLPRRKTPDPTSRELLKNKHAYNLNNVQLVLLPFVVEMWPFKNWYTYS